MHSCLHDELFASLSVQKPRVEVDQTLGAASAPTFASALAAAAAEHILSSLITLPFTQLYNLPFGITVIVESKVIAMHHNTHDLDLSADLANHQPKRPQPSVVGAGAVNPSRRTLHHHTPCFHRSPFGRHSLVLYGCRFRCQFPAAARLGRSVH